MDNPGTKRDYRDAIKSTINDPAYQGMNFYLVGHSAGADAVILAAHDMLSDKRIKGVAILDSYLNYTDENGQSVDINANGWANEVANTFSPNFFMGASSQTDTDFPTSTVGPESYLQYNHYALAVAEDVAIDIVNTFLSNLGSR